VPTTFRERLSDQLLNTGVELAAERELMTRSLRAAARGRPGYELATGSLLLAQCVDTLLLWLSTRLRPKQSARCGRVESS
jgi:hypothetical protein